jgi:hypothetical protein
MVPVRLRPKDPADSKREPVSTATSVLPSMLTVAQTDRRPAPTFRALDLRDSTSFRSWTEVDSASGALWSMHTGEETAAVQLVLLFQLAARGRRTCRFGPARCDARLSGDPGAAHEGRARAIAPGPGWHHGKSWAWRIRRLSCRAQASAWRTNAQVAHAQVWTWPTKASVARAQRWAWRIRRRVRVVPR